MSADDYRRKDGEPLRLRIATEEEMRELVAMHAKQPLETTVETISLDQVSDALATLESGQSKGRFVIDFTG